jgi:hypothetical protein
VIPANSTRGGRSGSRKVFARLILAALGFGILGCHSYSDFSGRTFTFKEMFQSREDPLVVLRDSNDGTKRSRAMLTLKEPLQHGGSRENQELYVKILTTAAREDHDPLCRLAAVRALGKYKDARAVQALEDVYQQRLAFTNDLNSLIRQQALAALEESGDPEARRLLIRVARQPGSPTESSLTDRQQTLDERLTAIRGLAKYPQYDSVDALVHVMETEKDAALKERAYQSLKTATGKNLPAEGRAWRELLQNPDAQAARPEPNFLQRVVSIGKEK